MNYPPELSVSHPQDRGTVRDCSLGSWCMNHDNCLSIYLNPEIGPSRCAEQSSREKHPPSLCSFRTMLKARFGHVAQNPILPNQHFVGKPGQRHVRHEAIDVPSKTRPSSSNKRYHSKQAAVYVGGLKTKASGFIRCLCPLLPSPATDVACRARRRSLLGGARQEEAPLLQSPRRPVFSPRVLSWRSKCGKETRNLDHMETKASHNVTGTNPRCSAGFSQQTRARVSGLESAHPPRI